MADAHCGKGCLGGLCTGGGSGCGDGFSVNLKRLQESEVLIKTSVPTRRRRLALSCPRPLRTAVGLGAQPPSLLTGVSKPKAPQLGAASGVTLFPSWAMWGACLPRAWTQWCREGGPGGHGAPGLPPCGLSPQPPTSGRPGFPCLPLRRPCPRTERGSGRTPCPSAAEGA